MSFAYHSYIIRMSIVCTRMSQVCYFVCHMSLVCHLYVLVFYLHVTLMYSYATVCHLYVLISHPHVTRIYSYVICMSLVYTRMSFVYHPYVIRMSLVCTRVSSICHLYVILPRTTSQYI